MTLNTYIKGVNVGRESKYITIEVEIQVETCEELKEAAKHYDLELEAYMEMLLEKSVY